jgi:hypothetical protein
MPRKPRVLSGSQRTCTSCMFCVCGRCTVATDQNETPNNRHLAITYLLEHKQYPNLDCPMWGG